MLFARAPTWAIVAADEPHYVWIDSVCINQDDVHEKNIQVSMMDMIYSKAASVVAFLRPEDDNESDIATHFLESLGRDHRQQRRRTYGITPWLLGTYHSVFDGLMDSSKGPSPGWNALTKLIGNKFWSRVWIVQELVLAPIDLRIFYGDHELCWINFCLFCQRIPSTTYIDFTYALQVFGENIMGTRLRVCETLRLRNKRMDEASLALTDLLLAVRNMGSTNPLDRVYAFVGIAPALASHITIEYSKPNEDPRPNIERLYTEFAAYLLREDPEWLLTMAGSGYSILEEVNVGKKNVEEENVDPLRHSYSGIRLNLPSWVPDLQSPSPTPLPNMRDRSAIEIQQTTIRMRNSTNILKTQNWIEITTVDIDYLTNEATDDLFPINRTPLGKHDDIFGYMNRMVRLWEFTQTLANSQANRPGESVLRSLYETITAGSGDHFESFERFLQIIEQFLPDYRAAVSDRSLVVLLRTVRRMVSLSSEGDRLNSWQLHTDVCTLRKVALSHNGHLALVPRLAKPDDCIHRLKGTETFLVLRRIDSGRSYRLIGNCYLNGGNQLANDKPALSIVVK
jgi:hypothetical protein